MRSTSSASAQSAGSVDLLSSIEEVADEWEDLAGSVAAGPFARPGWFAAWLAAFGGDDARALVATRRGDLAAVLPLVGRAGRLASPTNWHTPAFGPVARDENAEHALAAALPRHARSSIDLSFLDPDSAFAQGLAESGRTSGFRMIRRPVLRSPYLDLEGTFEELEAGRNAKLRRELARRTKRLEESGEVSIAFEDGRHRLTELLDEGFAVEGSGWKTERGTALATDAPANRFYRDVAAWAAAQGWLQLGFLRLDGRCLAFSYSIVLDGVVHVVKVGFDPGYRKFAPGSILTRSAIQRAFGQGARRYDFLGADDRYKLDWTDTVKERVRLQLFGGTPSGMAGYAAWRYGRPAAKRALGALRERRPRGSTR